MYKRAEGKDVDSFNHEENVIMLCSLSLKNKIIFIQLSRIRCLEEIKSILPGI